MGEKRKERERKGGREKVNREDEVRKAKKLLRERHLKSIINQFDHSIKTRPQIAVLPYTYTNGPKPF